MALAQSRWSEAKQLAQQAQDILSAIPSRELINISGLVSQLSQESVIRHDSSLYKYIFAQAEHKLGGIQKAIDSLETALADASLEEDLRLYLNILSYLQQLYFEQKEYLKAYTTKQQQRSVEQQFGLRAFIGAGRLQSTKFTNGINLKGIKVLFTVPVLARMGNTLSLLQETIQPECGNTALLRRNRG